MPMWSIYMCWNSLKVYPHRAAASAPMLVNGMLGNRSPTQSQASQCIQTPAAPLTFGVDYPLVKQMFTSLVGSGLRDLCGSHTNSALFLLPMIVTREKQTKFLFKYLISVEETRGFPSNSNSRQLWLKNAFSPCAPKWSLVFIFWMKPIRSQILLCDQCRALVEYRNLDILFSYYYISVNLLVTS